MEILPPSLRTGVTAQLVLLVALLLGRANASQNYFEVNGVFASTELMEDLALAEEEIIRQLETLYHLTTQAAQGIKQHVDDWRLTTGRASHRNESFASQLGSSSHQESPETIQEPSGIREFSNNYTLRVEHQLRKIANGSKAGMTYHPVDAFLLLRRTAISFKKLSKSLAKMSNSINETLHEIETDVPNLLPTFGDWEGATTSMLDLHDVYNFTAGDMAKGIVRLGSAENLIVQGLESRGRLTVHDAVLLARVADKYKMKKLADDWFTEAAAMLDSGAECPPDVAPYIPRMREAQKNAHNVSAEETPDRQQEVPKLRRIPGPGETEVLHKLLCSGKHLLSSEEESFLSCRLERLQSSYLLLMPLKLEELSLSPRVVLYRDFLSEVQTEYFVRNAKPELDVAEVRSNNETIITMYRVSATAFLGKPEFGRPGDPVDPNPEVDTDEFLTNMNKRIEQSTGLRVATTRAGEVYQVANYGIGGKYDPHYDFGTNNNRHGDRFATFLMYLSDVEAGGDTVFPLLGLRVRPVKGTALVWHNLLPNGGRSMLMLHAACPVLHGNKWIVTKWILYDEQFQKRPCSLDLYARL